MLVTILTALRGDPALSARWAASVAARVIEADIIAAVNNADDKKIVEDLGGTVIIVKPYTAGPDDEVARVNYIATVYDALVKAAKTPWVLLLDDDILPPFDGYERLLDAGDAAIGPGVAGVVTVYPFKGPVSEQSGFFWMPYDWICAPMSTVPLMGLHKVWGGGTGFSLWRKDVIAKTLPWSTQDYGDGNVPGWDRDLAIKLYDMKATTYLDCSILSRHDNLP